MTTVTTPKETYFADPSRANLRLSSTKVDFGKSGSRVGNFSAVVASFAMRQRPLLSN